VYFNMANGTAWCGRPPVTRDIGGIVTHIGRQIINTSYAPDWVARMTLSNYWRKWVPEYKENSKEAKRYRM